MCKVTLAFLDEIAIVTLANPPVNALSTAVRTGLLDTIRQALASSPRAVVLTGAGSVFCAGADIREFGSARHGPSAHEIQSLIESAPVPVIARVNGTAFGGGFELALSCHWRLATAKARFALPEVRLGLLPGAGGTQRLTRLVGAPKALELITTGAAIDADAALALGIVDSISSGESETELASFAEGISDRPDKLKQVRLLTSRIRDVDPNLFSQFRQNLPAASKQVVAVENCIRCVEAACSIPFSEGLELERKLFRECHEHPQRAAQIHVFFSERAGSNLSDARGHDKKILVGLTSLHGTFAQALGDGLQRAGVTTTDADLGGTGAASACDVLLDMDDSIAGLEEGAAAEILSLPLQAIATTGLHAADNSSVPDSLRQKTVAFYPLPFANGSRFVELQALSSSTEEPVGAVCNVMKLGGWFPVRTKYGKSFVAHDIIVAFLHEAELLLLEGASLADVDGAAEEHGFLAGPFRAADTVNGSSIDAGLRLPRQRDGVLLPVRRSLLSQCSGSADSRPVYYDRSGGRPVTSDRVAQIVTRLRHDRGIVAREVTGQEILLRLAGAAVAACNALHDGGRVFKSSDLDILCLGAIGFPRFRGGPLYQASREDAAQPALRTLGANFSSN